MNKYVAFFIVLTAISCRQNKPQFYAYEQWMIPGGYNTIPLKASPKEVKETLFSPLADSTFDAIGQSTSSDIWRFDEKGNIIYRKNLISDSLWFETTDSRNEKGLQSETRYMDGHSSPMTPATRVLLVTQPLPDGRFKKFSSGNSSSDIVEFISFSHSGDVQTIESPGDDKQPGKTTTYEYKNGIFQHSTSTGGGQGRTETNYFYSKDNYPDSVLTRYNGKLNSRTIYTNNIHGDPVATYTLLANGDTVNAATLHYVYDDKGNWTRQLKKETISSTYRPPGYKDGRYSLIVREIKY